MDASQFEVDERSGLRKWPVLWNGDWSRWTDSSCAVLYGETWGWDELQCTVGELLRSSQWPDLSAFSLGRGGFLVMAPAYKPEQALLLAQWVNRELEGVDFHRPPWATQLSSNPRLTWGIAYASGWGWSLPCTLQRAILPVQRAVREKRFGSINETTQDCVPDESSLFWVCARRDGLTGLNSWQYSAALCSHYADEPMALLMGNIDRFKTVNDLYGLGSGDVVLQMLAHVLRRFESNDVAAFRSGGDEFMIWMRGQSLERAKQLAEQINAQVRALQIPVPGSAELISNISLTWAVVAVSPRELDVQKVLVEAGELLDQTKREQRGSVSARRF